MDNCDVRQRNVIDIFKTSAMEQEWKQMEEEHKGKVDTETYNYATLHSLLYNTYIYFV